MSDKLDLLPCPVCGAQPFRNGRLGAGGVLCSANNPSHRLQTYGADQDAADAAWNTRAPSDRVKALEAALGKFLSWADQKCPCINEEPNPCTPCGASVENLEPCKAADKTLPRSLLDLARNTLKDSHHG